MELYVVINKNKEYLELSGLWVKELSLHCLFSNMEACEKLQNNLKDSQIVIYNLTKKRLKKT